MPSNVSTMSNEERIRLVHRIRVHYPQFNHILNMIRECHQLSQHTTTPVSMLITGEPGAGKSTLYETYINSYDETIVDENHTKRRILSAIVPSPTSYKTVADKLLQQLGDPFFRAGKTKSEKTTRLVNFIRDCEVELIMLDEFQNFLKPGKIQADYEVSEWFKSLINQTNVPVILFGLKNSINVLNCNPQLDRRFRYRHHIEPFSDRSNKRFNEFRTFLKIIDEQLPFDEVADLYSAEMSRRLFDVGNGKVDPTIQVIRMAAERAIKLNKSQVTLGDFAVAFDECGYLKGRNPFVGDLAG